MHRIVHLAWIFLWLPTLASAENLEQCIKGDEARILGNLELAVSHYTQCIEQGDLSTASLLKAHYDRGNAYLIAGQLSQAILNYDEAVRLDPSNANVLIDRGIALTRMGQFNRAILDFDQAIRLAPNDDTPLFNRGNANSAKRQFDRAIQDFSEAIRLNPDNQAAYNNRGLTFRQTGQYDKAILDFGEALRIAPNNESAYFNRGVARTSKRQFDKAALDFSEAIRLNPAHTSSLSGRGRAKFLSGDFDAAVSDFKTAVSLLPGDPYAVIWLFLAQTRSGRDGRNDLIKNAAPFTREQWPGPIIAMLLEHSTAIELVYLASDPDSERQKEKKTEAYFYAGQKELAAGNRTGAVGYFRETVKTGITRFIEYIAAEEELKRLGN